MKNIKQIFEKIYSIYNGWKNLIIKDETLSPLFDSRMGICNSCEYNIKKICSKCGCFLPAKTKSIIEDCPIGKWLPHQYIDDNNSEYILRSELPIKLQSYFDKDEIDFEEWMGFLINHSEDKKE